MSEFKKWWIEVRDSDTPAHYKEVWARSAWIAALKWALTSVNKQKCYAQTKYDIERELEEIEDEATKKTNQTKRERGKRTKKERVKT